MERTKKAAQVSAAPEAAENPSKVGKGPAGPGGQDPSVTEKRIASAIADELKVRLWQVEAAVALIDEGNTIPFIARYRKEATGTLDDTQLRTLDERLAYLRTLEDRKAKVLESIAEQGQLTEDLRAQIEAAATQVAVEDLYRPFRPRRRTRAGCAAGRAGYRGGDDLGPGRVQDLDPGVHGEGRFPCLRPQRDLREEEGGIRTGCGWAGPGGRRQDVQSFRRGKEKRPRGPERCLRDVFRL